MNIRLCNMTKAKMHAFFKDFRYDSCVSPENADYEYDKTSVDNYYKKHSKQGKLHYAIMLGDSVIGDIYLKNICKTNRSCELGIHMVNDHYKGKGYGTQALHQIKEITTNELKMKTLYASTSEENIKCRRALEKAGFTEIKRESGQCLYECCLAQ